jgi:hypothetical protein
MGPSFEGRIMSWPERTKLHPREREGAVALPCGCVDLTKPEGLRSLLRSVVRYVGLEPTGRERWRREQLGWRLVHGGGREVFFAGVRHVTHDRYVPGVHQLESPVEAAVAVHRAVWRFTPSDKRSWH